MSIPKSLEAQFQCAGEFDEARRTEAQRRRGADDSPRRPSRGRIRREAEEAKAAARFVFEWLDSDDARRLQALANRHRVQAVLSGGIREGAKHQIALGTEPGTLHTIRIAFGVSTTVVTSAEELARLFDHIPEQLIRLAVDIRSDKIVEHVARGLDRDTPLPPHVSIHW